MSPSSATSSSAEDLSLAANLDTLSLENCDATVSDDEPPTDPVLPLNFVSEDYDSVSEPRMPMTPPGGLLRLEFLAQSFAELVWPTSNLEALYLHQCPCFQAETAQEGGPLRQQPTHQTSAGLRSSLAPLPSTGASTSTTKKFELLKSIMQTDTDLLETGVRITLDPVMLSELDNSLRAVLNTHSDAEYMNRWNLAVMNETEVLSTTTLTDETTTTGVFRTTLYRLCNLFTRYTPNYRQPFELEQMTSSLDSDSVGEWRDPPTTTKSNLDVACWDRHCRSCCGVEHKRFVVCQRQHMEEIVLGAGQQARSGDEGIHIVMTDDGMLDFRNFAGSQHTKSLLAQVNSRLGFFAILSSIIVKTSSAYESDPSNRSSLNCGPTRLPTTSFTTLRT